MNKLFEFNHELQRTITKCAVLYGMTESDVIRRAVASYSYLRREVDRNEGRKLCIATTDDVVVKDVILP